MLKIKSIKFVLFTSLLLLVLVGCGGSSSKKETVDDNSSTQENVIDDNSTETVDDDIANGEVDGDAGENSDEEDNDSSGGIIPDDEVTLQDSVTLLELDFVGDTEVESGRTVTVRAFINSDEDNELPIYYYLADSEFLENNSTETGTSIASNSLSVTAGTTHYDTDIVLPNDLETGDYKVIGIIFPEELVSIDANNTDEQMELYEKLYAVTNNSFHITANDGKPDVEVTYISIKNNDKVSVNATSRALPSKISVLELKPNILIFDLAIIDDKVLLNSKDLSFNGRFGIITSNALAENVSVSACITLLDSCEDVQFYAVNDDNETIYSDDFILDTVNLDEEMDVLYNVNIKEELLESLVKEVINNASYAPKLRITLFGLDEASTQDVEKNVMEVALTFAPVVLSGSNVDNSEDSVAQALPDFKLTKQIYLDDLIIKQPTAITDGWVINKPINPKLELIKPLPEITTELQLADTITPVNIATNFEVEITDLATEEVTEKVFGKEFELKAENSYFGAHALLFGEGTLDSSGIAAIVEGFVKLKIFGSWKSLLEADSYAGINPSRLSETGYNMDLEALGINIYSRSQDISSEYGLANSALGEVQSRIKENIEIVETYMNYNSGDLIRYSETFSVNKSVRKSTTIMAGPVPVTVSGEISGAVGMKIGAYIYDISRATARLNPQASIDASASAGVGFDGCSLGVNGEVSLIKEDFVAHLVAEMTFEGDDDRTVSMLGELQETITNTITGPSGNIRVYADYPYIDICYKRACACCGRACVNVPYPCGGCRTAHKTIANFSSTRNRTELLNQHQTLFRIGF